MRSRRVLVLGLVLVGLVVLGVLARFTRVRAVLARFRAPYVVLVSIDTLHVAYTGVYRPGFAATPHLDRMARAGTVFEHAYTLVPVTLPSHTTLLTGLSPLQTGVMANGDRVPAQVVTLAEILRSAGYQTAAFVSLGVLKHSFGLDQGFTVYDDDLEPRYHRWYRTADEVYRAAAAWVLRSYRRPFFLWVHFADPHEPYVAPDAPPDVRLELDGRVLGRWCLARDERIPLTVDLEPGRHRLRWVSLRPRRADDRPDSGLVLRIYNPAEVRPYLADAGTAVPEEVRLDPEYGLELENPRPHPVTLRVLFGGKVRHPPPSEVHAAYPREVAWADRHLGRLWDLLRRLQIDRRTLWVVVSDHGEGLYRHGVLGHAEFVYEDQLRILWLLRGPGVPRGRRVAPVALMTDVLPTVLDLLGLPPVPGATGTSRVPCWSDHRCPERDAWWAYGVNHKRGRLTAVAAYLWPYKWLWTETGGRHVYDVMRDPGETTELGLGPPGTMMEPPLVALVRRGPRFRRLLVQQFAHRQRPTMTPEVVEMLKSLGYIGGNGDRNE